MSEKQAVSMAIILGSIVLILIVLIGKPFSWGKELPNKTAKEDVASSQAVSGEAISGAAISATATSIADYQEELESEKDLVNTSPSAIGGDLVNAEGKTLRKRVMTPKGYTRIAYDDSEKKSLATFIREYKVYKDLATIKLYNKNLRENQSTYVAIMKLPIIEDVDLQQCADCILRIYADYFWQTKQFDKISFKLVDGFDAVYSKWRDGSRINVGESQTTWLENSQEKDESYECFEKYLRIVFAYANTASLEGESKKIKIKDVEPGDILVRSGATGHAVMVIDVCQNQEGKKAFLLGQGFSPAQNFEVLKNPLHENDPWYYEEEAVYPIKTPLYDFGKGSLRRPNYIQ